MYYFYKYIINNLYAFFKFSILISFQSSYSSTEKQFIDISDDFIDNKEPKEAQQKKVCIIIHICIYI